MKVEDHVEEFGRTLGEELLAPTKIYVKTISNLRRGFRLFGISHITGGGLTENLPRILPSQCKVVINTASWIPQPVFQYLKRAGNITNGDMLRTFNNGLGLVIVVSEEDCNEVLLRLKALGETAYHIGEVEARQENDPPIEFIN